MSWQAYVDSSLVGSGHLDKAAIISAAGDSAWATTAGFTLKPEEMKHIADILDNASGAVDKAYAEGVYVGGVRYVLTKVEGRSLYARQGRNGLCVAKTKQAILVGHHGETHQAGNATQTVEALADYLIGVGY
ncbi:Profilin/allergen [Coniochaeta ligniaria NRRL 30616]|uniref:Profilin n=1 Tax=Coniochaeta ligniaria NRRL 30616 TaxID=1408157 RepID=A0A1J7JR29_9PEZI|nr:Profilin/allergen [Coniochaeta ligniaria NRRL 30616]